jgi:hypothetical protein
MFIVWGRKLVYRKAGFVADFCPLCRSVQTFVLQRVGSAGHVYYVTVGEGDLVGYERTCQTCGTSLAANHRTYASIAKKAVPLADLRRETFPNLDEAHKDRLELEDKVRRSPSFLSPDERRELIRSPFMLLAPKVEQRLASTHLDKEIGFSFLGAFLIGSIGPALAHAVAPDFEGESFLFFWAVGIGVIIWQFMMSGHRVVKRQVVPVLARALAPLKPSETELQAVLAELKQHKTKLGSKLKVADLQTQLTAAGETTWMSKN